MIRLTSIHLENFKNTESGTVSLSSWIPSKPLGGSDVIGLYGQNGSGKTSVIQALAILKKVLTGDSLQNEIADCVSRATGESTLSFEGALFSEEKEAEGQFSYSLTICVNDAMPKIRGEKLAYKDYSMKKPVFKTLFEYERAGDGSPFLISPKTAWEPLLRIDDICKMQVLVTERVADGACSSLLFSTEFLDVLSKLVKADSRGLSKKALEARGKVAEPLMRVAGRLFLFGHTGLAIVSATQQAEGMANRLRISTHEGEFGIFADNGFDVNLLKPTLLSEENYAILKRTIASIAPVMAALVPGLELGVRELEKQLGDDGNLGIRAELVCTRGEVTIPLRCESEGIKKLVSILVLLVDVYSEPGACVAIDEFDSGVFEFLLGEILQVLQDHGRGQLIFTAHNLRPLEIVDKGSLVFTTANPKNRYVPFKGSRESNNLRSQYLRAINLGGQPEMVYEPTNKFAIDSAFFEAGMAAKEGVNG